MEMHDGCFGSGGFFNSLSGGLGSVGVSQAKNAQFDPESYFYNNPLTEKYNKQEPKEFKKDLYEILLPPNQRKFK